MTPARPRRLGVTAALVDGEFVPGDVAVTGTVVEAVGLSPPGRTGIAVPGFVDLQVNGFAGIDFTTADPDGHGVALAAMARHGVTACLPTLPTAAPDAYPAALAALAVTIGRPPPGTRAVGVHLEGPFLNPRRRGAHPERWLRPPDGELLRSLLAAAPVAVLTLAPELPGADALIAEARRRGVVVSLGHTEASADEAHTAFDAGASMVTHLWNAHAPLQSRLPGIAGAALHRPGVAVGLIADLAHVAADTLLVTLAAAGRRAFVVTDALDLAGLPPGPARRPDGRVHLSAGTAVRLEDGTLAGSALTMDGALRNLVGLGVDLAAAVDLVSGAPGRALGRPGLGVLRPGGPADVVVLDDRLGIRTVLVGGDLAG